ncbi:hypothetical protein L7F22_046165 [Adiantum nelumboides]|nr:hypothetical protein [Adiantum nelumboides]
MATMLGFIFTDAAVEADWLQRALLSANAPTFSCITVDGDTSTSDTVLAFATGKAGNVPLTDDDSPGADAFRSALNDLCRQLAMLVVRDGEGATKLIEIAVTGGRERPIGPPHRDEHRQLAAGEDRDRGRGRELGPRRHGGRQGGRTGRARQPVDPLRRYGGRTRRSGGRRL